MANAISFRGLFIRSAHMSNPEGASRTLTLACTSDFTPPAMGKMEWGEIDPAVTGAKLKGKLLATVLELVPSDKELKKFGLELPIDVVRDFEVVGIKDKEGDITHRELRFTIESSAKNAARLVEEYCARLSRHPGLGKVSYTKQAGSEEDEDDSQMTLLGAVAATAE